MDVQLFHQNTVTDGHSDDPRLVDHFCLVPETGGSINFGQIGEEPAKACGLLAVPIRVVNGNHRGSNYGYGVRHILMQHGAELAAVDYFSVQDFIRDVALYFDRVYLTSNRPMIALKPDDLAFHRLLVLELDQSQTHYRVVTGYMREGYRKIKGTLAWERRDRSPRPEGVQSTVRG